MRWANEHPEEMAEIAALPPSQQNAALREAMGYDPDAIRDRFRENGDHHHRSLTSEGPPGQPPEQASSDAPHPSQRKASGDAILSRRRTAMDCDSCGALEGFECQPWCLGERYS